MLDARDVVYDELIVTHYSAEAPSPLNLIHALILRFCICRIILYVISNRSEAKPCDNLHQSSTALVMDS